MFSVLKQFLVLGLMSFGGPAAHIGYFRKRFVAELGWLNEQEFAAMVAVSHLLPGPGSSQVGFAIGLHKAGWAGGICAFIGFTLPSFLLMVVLASIGQSYQDNSWTLNIIHGLKLLAVIVVADAILAMFQSFCKDRLTMSLCVLSAIVMLLSQSVVIQVVIIAVSGCIGYFFCRPATQEPAAFNINVNMPLMTVFVLLFGLSFFVIGGELLQLFLGYFNVGSLVYGGGHVVLPLLEQLTSETVSSEQFISGYALAQGVPGPMFTFATFLGFNSLQDTPILGASLATLGIFFPGFLLLACFRNSWTAITTQPTLMAITATINAAVVGLLVAAFYQPVFSYAVLTASDFAIVLVGFLALRAFKVSILALMALVVTLAVSIGMSGLFI